MTRLTRFKERFKDFVWSHVLAHRPAERLLQLVANKVSKDHRRLVELLFPQPHIYKSGARRRVTRYGFDWELDPSRYFDWHHYFERPDPVLEMLGEVLEPGGTAIDVGANNGLYACLMARRVGSDGEVVAVEPHPETFEMLERHLRWNAHRVDNVDPINCGLGRTDQEAPLHTGCDEDPGKSSLHTQTSRVGDDVRQVRVRRLDDLVEETGLDRVDFIKIDTEGHEPEVLMGATATLEDHRPTLCVEFTPQWYQDRRGEVAAILDRLDAYGYVFCELDIGGERQRVDLHRALDENGPQIDVLGVASGD